MVDLQSQHQHIQAALDQAIREVMDSTQFINGPAVQQFANHLADYLHVPYVIPCGNGTDALQIAMMALGLKAGDEVIVPAFTYAATAEVIALLGLEIVMADVDPGTFMIDPHQLKSRITPRTKAIVPVHLFGQCADMEALGEIAQEHGLFVIEDAAQAIGAEYTFSNGITQKAGTMGTVGATSFFPSKNLGCMGDGGALFTHDETLAKRMKMIANHGQSVQYRHEVIGINSRLDTIQAAILDVKLPHLDRYTGARRSVAAYYDRAFAGHPALVIPQHAANSTHVFHQYTLQLKGINRDGLRKYLEEHGIPSMVYYPLPLHFQQAYNKGVSKEGTFPVAENLCKNVISLPVSTEMDEEQLAYITSHVLGYCNNVNN